MPEANFDRNINLPTSGGKYIRLKAKGDKIRFLIANTPHYETKHWISDRDTILCNKYNGQPKGSVCKYCDEYKEALAKAGEDKKKIEAANKLRAGVTFYYPVLNLDTDEANIFQTAPSVHWTIVGYKEEGVDVFKCAWSVNRTEVAGNYYEVRRLDPVKLTPEQQEAYEQAKSVTLSKGKTSSSVVADEDAPLPEEQ